MSTYLRMLVYIKPYWLRIVAALICSIIAALGSMYVPWLARDMIDNVLADKNIALLNWLAISIVLVFMARGLFFYLQTYLMAYVGQHVVADIRLQIYKHLQTLHLAFFDKRKIGTVMSYVSNDVTAMQVALVDNATEFITEILVLLASIGAMLYIDWKLTLFTFSTFPIVLLVIDKFGRKIRFSGGQIQERAAGIMSILQETIASIRVVKSFVRENYEVERFGAENGSNLKASLKNSQQMAALTPVIEFIAALGVTAIIWYGGSSVINGELTAGSLIAFLVYAINIANPIKRITRVYGNIQRAMAAAVRIFEILDLQSDIKEQENAPELTISQGAVRFQNICFSYNDKETVLKDISFESRPGQMIAIVGPSGAGKSTIANLLPRFYDVQQGGIFIDGVDIRAVRIDSLREQIGIVPQETLLFNGTVYENIKYGRLEASASEIYAAARAANAEEFILTLTDGYDTMLGDRGVNLSGGQRQRIAIARALLKNPQILILDEATSALDTQSEQIVQEALDRLMVGRTSFVIAHRLSTIQKADRILVLDKGELVESGTHEELLRHKGMYAKLHQVQNIEPLGSQ